MRLRKSVLYSFIGAVIMVAIFPHPGTAAFLLFIVFLGVIKGFEDKIDR